MSILEEREKTHGSFKNNAEFSQSLKFLFRNQPSYLKMDVQQKEALDMIALKLGRIFSGQANFKDHWLDGSCYFQLGARACDEK